MPKKRTPQEIKRQLDGLKNELTGKAYSVQTRRGIKAQIKILEGTAISNDYWADEEDDEYQDGDNETFHAAVEAEEWLAGKSNKDLFEA